MKMQTIITNHFVKGEDLNHHGTLFAGRAAEWFVESGLMSAAACVPADNIVLVRINAMEFTRPVQLGEVLCFESTIVRAGRSSMLARISASAAGSRRINGYITFVNVNAAGKAQPHGLELEPGSEAQEAQVKEAEEFLKVNA